jgi:hypothetical protein
LRNTVWGVLTDVNDARRSALRATLICVRRGTGDFHGWAANYGVMPDGKGNASVAVNDGA